MCPQQVVSRRCRTRGTTTGLHPLSAHSCGVRASFSKYQLRPTPGGIFHAGLQSFVRIGCRVHQVARSAGLRHAGRVGHQTGRAYVRKIHPQLQRGKCFGTHPHLAHLGPLGPSSSARALAQMIRAPAHQRILKRPSRHRWAEVRAATELQLQARHYKFTQGCHSPAALLTTSCVHHQVNNREDSAA
jgi:hypothetical protein